MSYAFSGAIFIFVYLEVARYVSDKKITILLEYGKFIKKYLIFNNVNYTNFFKKRFIDSRDNDFLILTHIYLLFGCSYPFIFNNIPTLNGNKIHCFDSFI